MTQSGQGDEPSARPAREGIVLPSDGGEPLLPGRTGASAAGHDAGRHAPPVNPSGGRAWGNGDWEQNGRSHGAPPAAQAWPEAPAPSWPEPQGPSHQGGWDSAPQPSGGAGPLPPENPPAPGNGGHYDGYQQQYGGYGGQDAQGGYDPQVQQPQQSYPPAHHGYGGGADEGATQFIPPVTGGPGEAATQYIPPVGSGALPPELSHEPTQYLGQGGAGNLYGGAPQQTAGSDAEATRFMAPVDPHDSGGQYGNGSRQPDGQQGGQQGGHGLGQGDPENRTPPAEFDNLFRTDSGAEPQGSTQQFPRFQQTPAPAPYAGGPGAPQGGNGGDQWGTPDQGPAPRGRSGSRVPLIAAVGIGIVVLGVGAGALLSGGGGDDDKGAAASASASAPASGDSASPSSDAARAQAVALDKLLSQSGNSRASVIAAVQNVKACNNLGDAASDLRDASQQRKDLVTKLSQLSVDQLPDHAALTAALNGAWQASASADTHYAAWADQTAGKNGCKKGHARNTGQSSAGAAASGTATRQKSTAAGLWNAIAKTYGLTQRQSTQL